MRTKIATVPLVLIAFLCGGAALDRAYAKDNNGDEVTRQYRTDPAILKALGDPKTFNVLIYEKIFNTQLFDPRLDLAPSNLYGSTRTASKPKC
ncbi:MAG: hypothetical protein ABIS20_16035 [Thermoanaerobaculia bacterium]